jgi:hypothetical protein
MSKIMVTSRAGISFEVDISDEACSKFGFKHGDRIIDNNGDEGTVVGVADKTDNSNKKTLWYALDCDNGKVSYWETWANADFSLIPS